MAVLQNIVVAAIVLISVFFSIWRLLPARRRLWLMEHLLPLAWRRTGWIARREGAARAGLAGGCGTCSHNHSRRVHRPVAQRSGK